MTEGKAADPSLGTAVGAVSEKRELLPKISVGLGVVRSAECGIAGLWQTATGSAVTFLKSVSVGLNCRVV